MSIKIVAKVYIKFLIILIILNFVSGSLGISAEHQEKENYSGMGANDPGFLSWSKIDQKKKDKFLESADKFGPRRELYEKMYDEIGPIAMLEYLEQKYTLCHSQAHDLGKVIYSRQKDINQSLAICGNRCTNACMHGVVSEAFGDKSLDEVIKISKSFCDTDQMNKLHKKGNCMHGLGHALMIVSGHNLDKSLKACDEFGQPSLGYYCATGVFMEYRDNLLSSRKKLPDKEKVEHNNSNHEHHSKSTDESDISTYGDFYPCDTFKEYPAACYRYMFPLIRSKLNVSRIELVEKCKALPVKERRGCFHGLGLMYIVSVSRNPSNIIKLCDQGDYEDRVMCVEGVIEKLSDMNEEAGLKACSFLKGRLSEVCFSAAKEKMYRLNKPTMYLYLK